MDNNVINTPLVSIVIPTYNAGRYLLEAIDSVLTQTYPQIELIIVDDGSTDDTSEVLSSHPGGFKKFWQKNAGQSAAMNFGWKQSSGTIIGYLSADDRLHTDAIQTIVNQLLLNPSAVLAYPDFCIIDENSQHIREVITPNYSQKLLVANFQCLPGPGALFKRNAWLQAGDWSTSLRNIPDMDFFLRLSLQGPFLRIERTLADFRIHSGSTTYSYCSFERSNEPLVVVERFFAQANISSDLKNWRTRSFANALMLSGFMHGYSGRYYTCILRMLKAALISPPVVISKKMISYLISIFKSNIGTTK